MYTMDALEATNEDGMKITCRLCKERIPMLELDVHECLSDEVASVSIHPMRKAYITTPTQAKNKTPCNEVASRKPGDIHPRFESNTWEEAVQKQGLHVDDASSTGSFTPSPLSFSAKKKTFSPKKSRLSMEYYSRNSSSLDESDNADTRTLHPNPSLLLLPPPSPIAAYPKTLATPVGTTQVFHSMNVNEKISQDNLDANSDVKRIGSGSKVTSAKEECIQAAVIESFRITREGNITFTIHSTHSKDPKKYRTERRYREFHALAKQLEAGLGERPSQINFLPPKTYCSYCAGHATEFAFLMRRKEGLQVFLDETIRVLLHMTTTSDSSWKRTMGPLYLLHRFLQVPWTIQLDESMQELQRLALSTSTFTTAAPPAAAAALTSTSLSMPFTWKVAEVLPENDIVYEAIIDGFATIKRTKRLDFSTTDVLDLILTGYQDVKYAPLNPMVIHGELLSKLSSRTWTERLTVRGIWPVTAREFINLKSWRIDPDGTMILVCLPTNEDAWPETTKMVNSAFIRADCVLGGWVLKPIPDQDACMVTWLMQADFHGFVGSNSHLARRMLRSLSNQVDTLTAVLNASIMEVPKLFKSILTVEPAMMFMMHRNQMKSSLVFKAHLDDTSASFDEANPVTAQWVSMGDAGPQFKTLSSLEKLSHYGFKAQRVEATHYQLELHALKDRPLNLHIDESGTPRCSMLLNGAKKVSVQRVYLKFQSRTSPILERVDIFGLNTSGEMVRESLAITHQRSQ